MTFPAHYRKLVIHQLTGDFRSSTCVVTEPWRDPGQGEIVIRNAYAGCNAIFDKNLVETRYAISTLNPLSTWESSR